VITNLQKWARKALLEAFAGAELVLYKAQTASPYSFLALLLSLAYSENFVAVNVSVFVRLARLDVLFVFCPFFLFHEYIPIL